MWNLRKIPKLVLLFIVLLYIFVTVLLFISSTDLSTRNLFVFVHSDNNGNDIIYKTVEEKYHKNSLLYSEEFDKSNENYDDEAIYEVQYPDQKTTKSTPTVDLPREMRYLSPYDIDNFERKNLPQFSQFIFTSQMCAGLGNQMYRFASMYAIGKMSRRTPFYSSDEFCVREFADEIREIFPNFYEQIYFYKHPNRSKLHEISLKNCCKFDSSVSYKLKNSNKKAVKIIGATGLQSFRYFHAFRNEIRRIFKCAPSVLEQFCEYTNLLFGKDVNARKICVHTRLGDFVPLKIATNFSYTTRAIDFVIDAERKKHPKSEFAVILLGEDKKFLQKIRNTKELEERGRDANEPTNYYIPRESSRAADMCFAHNYCDALLITTHVSTFSFWIGYLMPDEATIYYNPDFGVNSPYSNENFPPEWIQIGKNFDKNKINNLERRFLLNLL